MDVRGSTLDTHIISFCPRVLSAFEESSAACISDMLRQVSNGQYLDAIRMAEKFIVHVEVLFATVDDLEYQFSLLSVKGTPPVHIPVFLGSLTTPQACPMSAKHVCSVARPSNSSHYSRTRRKPGRGGWG